MVVVCWVDGFDGMEGSGAGGAGCRVVLYSLVYFQLSGLRFRFIDLSFSTTGEW